MTQYFTKEELKIIVKALHHERGIANADVCFADSSAEFEKANDYLYKLVDVIKKGEEYLSASEGMKKSDLQTGMAIVTRDGEYFEVTESYDGSEKFIENKAYRIPLNFYNDDMLIDTDEYKHKHDIYKVYTPDLRELLYKRGE